MCFVFVFAVAMTATESLLQLFAAVDAEADQVDAAQALVAKGRISSVKALAFTDPEVGAWRLARIRHNVLRDAQDLIKEGQRVPAAVKAVIREAVDLAKDYVAHEKQVKQKAAAMAAKEAAEVAGGSTEPLLGLEGCEACGSMWHRHIWLLSGFKRACWAA